jgi:hypothetical protein
MYICPHPHRCNRCGFEADHSPHDEWPSPRTGQFIACPRCWENWLLGNIGEMLHSGWRLADGSVRAVEAPPDAPVR